MLFDCTMKKRVQRYQEHHRLYLKFFSYPLSKKAGFLFLSMSSLCFAIFGQGANVTKESDVEVACFPSYLEGMRSVSEASRPPAPLSYMCQTSGRAAGAVKPNSVYS